MRVSFSTSATVNESPGWQAAHPKTGPARRGALSPQNRTQEENMKPWARSKTGPARHWSRCSPRAGSTGQTSPKPNQAGQKIAQWATNQAHPKTCPRGSGPKPRAKLARNQAHPPGPGYQRYPRLDRAARPRALSPQLHFEGQGQKVPTPKTCPGGTVEDGFWSEGLRDPLDRLAECEQIHDGVHWLTWRRPQT